MSMSLCYRVMSVDTFKQINQGELSFYDADDEKDNTWDFYSMDLLEALPEAHSPLFALLNVEPIWSDKVEFGIYYNRDAIASVIDAFAATDLTQLASYMNVDDVEHFIQTAHSIQATFEDAQQNGMVIIGYAA